MKKNVPSTDPNGDAKRQSLEKAEQLMIVNIRVFFEDLSVIKLF